MGITIILVTVSDAPFEISVSVRLDKTVNGFPVTEAIVVATAVGRVLSFFRWRGSRVPELPFDPERTVHHVIGDRALRKRPVELARERHLERVHVLVVMVWVMIVVVQLVQMVVVEPERIRFGERGWRPERLLLSGLRRAPVHIFVGRRWPYDGVQWCELGVGHSGGVETTSAEEQRSTTVRRVLFVVAHRTRCLLAKILLEECLTTTAAGRLFRAAQERRREYLASIKSQFPATAVLLLLLLLLLVGRGIVIHLQRRRVWSELFQWWVGERQAVHLVTR